MRLRSREVVEDSECLRHQTSTKWRATCTHKTATLAAARCWYYWTTSYEQAAAVHVSSTRVKMDASRVDGTLPSILTESLTSLASHTTPTTALNAPGPVGVQSTAGMLGGLLFGVFTIVPSLLYWIISFITITLPTWIFSFLSRSFTLTLNMTTLLILLLAFASTVSWFVRYRFLNMYSRLPPEPQRKEPQVEVFPETQENDSKPGLSNYFDEFLSAIKVFGYLERPVFHELTRTMQTRKLIAGETLLLEEEKGFCLVVDGLVQIFVKSSRTDSGDVLNDESAIEDDTGDDAANGNRTYQLLTEVKNGAPMSSLFSILALFTETVKLRHDDEEDTSDPSALRPDLRKQSSFAAFTPEGTSTPGSDETTSPMGWNASSSRTGSRPRSSTNHRQGSAAFKEPPPLALDASGEHQHAQQSRYPSFAGGAPPKRARPTKSASAHPDIVARATVDTTIAIIPATAFHRLTRIYPKATAHIVQVILTRLQRVTLATGHAYLGLTSEVLRTERLMNKYTNYDLPGFLRGDALERLKDKFRKEQERVPPEEGMKGIALHNPILTQRRRSSSGLRRDAVMQARMTTRSSDLSSADPGNEQVSAGDLLTNIHAASTLR